MTFRGLFKQPVISGGLLACSALFWAGEVLAQASLPLDIDLTSGESAPEQPAAEASPQLTDDAAEDSTTGQPEGASSPATDTDSPENLDAPAAPSLDVSPLPPPNPLRPTETSPQNPSTVTDPPTVPDQLPDLSGPPPETPTENGSHGDDSSPDVPVQELASFLVGQDAETAVSMLERDGWMVTAQTPRQIQLDRGQLGLDLNIDDMTGKVVEVLLIDLI